MSKKQKAITESPPQATPVPSIPAAVRGAKSDQFEFEVQAKATEAAQEQAVPPPSDQASPQDQEQRQVKSEAGEEKAASAQAAEPAAAQQPSISTAVREEAKEGPLTVAQEAPGQKAVDEKSHEHMNTTETVVDKEPAPPGLPEPEIAPPGLPEPTLEDRIKEELGKVDRMSKADLLTKLNAPAKDFADAIFKLDHLHVVKQDALKKTVWLAMTQQEEADYKEKLAIVKKADSFAALAYVLEHRLYRQDYPSWKLFLAQEIDWTLADWDREKRRQRIQATLRERGIVWKTPLGKDGEIDQAKADVLNGIDDPDVFADVVSEFMSVRPFSQQTAKNLKEIKATHLLRFAKIKELKALHPDADKEQIETLLKEEQTKAEKEAVERNTKAVEEAKAAEKKKFDEKARKMGYVLPGEQPPKPEETKPQEAKPEETKPEETKPPQPDQPPVPQPDVTATGMAESESSGDGEEDEVEETIMSAALDQILIELRDVLIQRHEGVWGAATVQQLFVINNTAVACGKVLATINNKVADCKRNLEPKEV